MKTKMRMKMKGTRLALAEHTKSANRVGTERKEEIDSVGSDN